MDYYKTLNLEKEPFSNSPDPGLFFDSKQHLEALQKLEISIRLKRGLNVITGDVGTGKTTLSRQLIQKISYDPTLKYFLILDPGFSSTADFLSCILTHFTGSPQESRPGVKDDTALKEQIKKYLFLQGVDNNITTVLMIDEGQKLPIFCLEVLRELLNYETNDNKLLQIIIFAQKEFNDSIITLDNFNDRISFRYSLSPLGFSETKDLIDFRLKKSSAPGTTIPGFSFFAYVTIYRYTKGFPRKIINLCHHIMLGLIIKNKTSVSYLFVKSCAKQVFPLQPYRRYSLVPAVVVALILIGGTLFFDKNKFADFILAALKGTPAPVEMPVKYVVKEMPQKTSEVLPPVVIPIVKPAIIEPSEKKQEPLHKLPEFYGSLRVPKDETLFNMIEAVYGSYKKEYLEKLLSSNLKIKNPDHINAGMRVDFPIINPMDTFWKNETVCIHFSKESEFKNAFLAARKYQKRGVNVRILPGWDSQKGFLFLVVVNQPFENLSEANTYKKKLNGITEAICEKISSCNDGRKIL